MYIGSMYKNNDVENKIPVVLKSATSRECCVKEDFEEVDGAFENEKQIGKILLQSKHDDIVKYYEVAHINDKEYIVMDDLKVQGFKTVGDVYDELVKEKSDGDISIIRQYKMKLNELHNVSSMGIVSKKRKAEINKYKQHYNEKFKQKEEKKPKQNESISYEEKVRCFFEKTEHFKELKNILKLAIIFHNDIHEGNVMINLEQGIIKLIDFGYSTKKDDKYLKDKECNCANEFDICRYKYLKSAFYYLLNTNINKEKQPTL